MLRQELHRVHAIERSGKHQGRLPVNGFPGVDFGAMIQQRLERAHAARCGCGHQRSCAIRLGRFGARAGVQQSLNDSRIAAGACHEERRNAAIARSGVHIGASRQQQLHHLQVFIGCRPVQRRGPIALRRADLHFLL